MSKPICPLLTVDAIIPYQKKIVLIRRKNAPFKGMLALPGGFVEVGESVETACVRETEEETGLKVSILKLLGVYSDPARDPRGHTVTIVFSTQVENGTLAAASDAESIECVKSLPQEMAFDHRAILQEALKVAPLFP